MTHKLFLSAQKKAVRPFYNPLFHEKKWKASFFISLTLASVKGMSKCLYYIVLFLCALSRKGVSFPLILFNLSLPFSLSCSNRTDLWTGDPFEPLNMVHRLPNPLFLPLYSTLMVPYIWITSFSLHFNNGFSLSVAPCTNLDIFYSSSPSGL